jgi:tyrosyl-tRNA synthetase
MTDIEKRIELISREPTEEVITTADLRELLQSKDKPTAYDGIEPSGMAHLGTGIMRAIKIEDMLNAGCHFKLLVADWFGWINDKLGGDLETIQAAGKYLTEVWKAAGVDTKKVEIIWTSEMVKDPDYWKTVIKISKDVTLNRMIRCGSIMGRKEKEMQYTSQVLYPAMQCTDIFRLKADICQLGLDQRKVNILAREIGEKLGYWKPVAVHHHMLMGLLGPQKMGGFDASEKVDSEIASKMSKSIPNSCVFVHDSADEIKKKINGAFCPEKQGQGNSVMEICKYIVFRKNKSLLIERNAKYGGNAEFFSYDELAAAYGEGKIHPADLKANVARELDKIIAPVRKHFEKRPELLEVFKKAEITR